MVAMANILFMNGVSQIIAIAPSIGSIPSEQNYSDALQLLNTYSDFYCLCCDSPSPSVLSLLSSYCNLSFDKLQRPILAFAPANTSSLPDNKFENHRLFLTTPISHLINDSSIASPALTAAGISAAVASAPSPIYNLSKSDIHGLSLVSNQFFPFNPSSSNLYEKTSLLESSLGSLKISRIIPSGLFNKKRLNINSILILDHITSDIYALIKKIYSNPFTLSCSKDSLISQIFIILDSKKRSSLLTNFDIPKVSILENSSISIELFIELPFIANILNLRLSTKINH
jgi:hypothetical protein